MKKQTTNYSGEEMERHVGALKEHFTDSVKVVAEQFFGLRKEMKDGFKEINKRLDSHTEMIGKIMIQLEEVKGELKQKVNYQDFVKLEKRVVYLETRVH